MKEISEEDHYLVKYAKLSKHQILLNKFLYEKLQYLTDYNKMIKKILDDTIFKQNMDQKTILDNYKNKMKADNDNFKKDYEKLNNKYNYLDKIYESNIPIRKPILLEENDNFCLEFIKTEKSDIIKLLNKSIKQSYKHPLYREYKRDTLVKKERGDKEMERYYNDIQIAMLGQLKKYNEFNEKIKKYNSKKKELLKNINLLNKYISNNNKHKTKIIFNEPENNKIKAKSKKKLTKEKKKTFQSVGLVFNKENVFEGNCKNILLFSHLPFIEKIKNIIKLFL